MFNVKTFELKLSLKLSEMRSALFSLPSAVWKTSNTKQRKEEIQPKSQSSSCSWVASPRRESSPLSETNGAEKMPSLHWGLWPLLSAHHCSSLELRCTTRKLLLVMQFPSLKMTQKKKFMWIQSYPFNNMSHSMHSKMLS